MLIFKDIISGDEVCSDTYPTERLGVLIKVKGKMVKKDCGIDDALIGGNASAEGGDEGGAEDAVMQVVNVVESHQLVETPFDKASYKSYIKGYMKAIKERLEEEKKDTKEFMAGAQTAVKEILENFKDYQFYLGESMNADGMVVLCKWEDDSPYFYFFKDGVVEEKV